MNENLSKAKQAKNDEFYTQYSDIEAEMNAYVAYNAEVFRGKTLLLPCDDPEWSNFTKYFAANFERFGLKKLISTSYAKGAGNEQLTLFEQNSPLFDQEKHETRGKLFTLTHDTDGSGSIDSDDIEFSGYLEGDGDFRSAELRDLRDEADIIITNPPFSLFREFLAWIMDGEKQFIILGNKNAVTCKEVFPLLKDNKVWVGYTPMSKDLLFHLPEKVQQEMLTNKKLGSAYRIVDGQVMGRSQSIWFTNIEHGKRHETLQLDTMDHNLKYNKKLRKKLDEEYGTKEYPHYDNYDALEVPFTECIPSNYDGVMGVPVTFLDKYNPEQFEITGITLGNTVDYPMTRLYRNAIQHNNNGSTQGGSKVNTRAALLVPQKPLGTVFYTADNASGYLLSIYPRILIRPKKGGALQ